MERKIAVIANSIRSARGEIHRAAEKLGATAFETTKPGEAVEIAKRCASCGFDVVVAMGGDGTINEVVNGLHDGDRLISPKTLFAVIPSGTGNDFARALGISKEYALDNILRGRATDVDLCDLSCISAQTGAQSRRRYINIAEAGFGALVTRNADLAMQYVPRRMKFITGLFRTLPEFADMKFTVNGRKIPCAAVIVANARFFGKGMCAAPHARWDDGILEIVYIRALSLPDVVFNLHKIYLKSKIEHAKFSYERAASVEISCEKRTVVEADGDPIGFTPCSMRILPEKLKVIV